MKRSIVNKYLFFLCLVIGNSAFLFSLDSQLPKIIKKAHLSADWYWQDKVTLLKKLDYFSSLSQNYFAVPVDASSVRALVVPHAGYRFSALCDISAYRALKTDSNKNSSIKKVIILAPSHSVPFQGVALPYYDEYQTILGSLPVDAHAINILKGSRKFNVNKLAHDTEHSLEIQLPFIQYTFENAAIVPLIVGIVSDKDASDIAQTLTKIIDDSTVVIVSSDFTHQGSSYDFVPYTQNIVNNIKQCDSNVVRAIMNASLPDFKKALALTQPLIKQDVSVCGLYPLYIFISLLNTGALGKLTGQLSCYYTSAHMQRATQGEIIKVPELIGTISDADTKTSVSYVGLVFAKEQDEKKKVQLTGYEKGALLAFARESINASFEKQDAQTQQLLTPIQSNGLQSTGGVFVTLKKANGDLRGCIGRIESNEPILKIIPLMAQAASFEDTRFMPLQKSELNSIDIEISLLSKPYSIKSYNDIHLGIDGIVLNKIYKGSRSQAVFLPQVATEFGWDLPTTLQELSQKAGLPSDAWKSDTTFKVFQSTIIDEKSTKWSAKYQ